MAGNLRAPEAETWRREFGTRVRELRTVKGISQEQLAHDAGVHRTYACAVERGEQNISLVLIHRFTAALNVSPSAFFD